MGIIITTSRPSPLNVGGNRLPTDAPHTFHLDQMTLLFRITDERHWTVPHSEPITAATGAGFGIRHSTTSPARREQVEDGYDTKAALLIS